MDVTARIVRSAIGGNAERSEIGSPGGRGTRWTNEIVASVVDAANSREARVCLEELWSEGRHGRGIGQQHNRAKDELAHAAELAVIQGARVVARLMVIRVRPGEDE